jgi:hypothetical protein
MESLGTLVTFLQSIATEQSFTLLGLLTVAYFGWAATKRVVGSVGNLLGRATFAGGTAALLGIGGLSATGVGIGELHSRWNGPTEPAAATPADVNEVVKTEDVQELISTANGHTNPEIVTRALDVFASKSGAAKEKLYMDLVKATTADNKDVIMAILEQLATTEAIKAEAPAAPVDDTPTKSASATFASLTDTSDEQDEEQGPQLQAASVEAVNADSYLTLSGAWALILAGIGATSGAGLTLRQKKKDDAATPEEQAA